MNLIVSGDNPKNLAKVEALARELGLVVSREIGGEITGSGRSLQRWLGKKTSEGDKVKSGRALDMEIPHKDNGPLYGIE